MTSANRMKTGVIIVAAGNSSRMNGIDKQLSIIHGLPVILYSVNLFQELKVDEIVVVAGEHNVDQIEKTVLENNVKFIRGVVCGGATRSESVAAGYNRLSSDCNIIAVHDGARPLLTIEKAAQVLRDGANFGAAILAVPVKETVKVVEGTCVASTPERSQLYNAQTPQVFRRHIFEKMLACGVNASDDSAIAERLGYSVHVTLGDYENIKITTPEDLGIAAMLLSRREASL